MELSSYIQQLYDYNYWANHQVLHTASSLSEDQLHHQQGHSWGSIFAVLKHMLNAEWIWLQRWMGTSPKNFNETEMIQDMKSLQEYWQSLETQMRSFIAGKTEEDLLTEIGYTNTKGKTYRLPLWQMMVHVPNHNTHHRGELAGMLTTMDIEHQEDDWIGYFLETSKQG